MGRTPMGVKKGEKCYWVDPDNNVSNGWYEVYAVDGISDQDQLPSYIADNPFFSWDEAVIHIYNEYSQAEVYLCELRFGKTKKRRKCQ